MSGAPVLPGEGLQLSLSWVFHLGPSEEWRRMQGNAAFAHVPGRVFVSRGRRTVAISDHLRLSFAFHFLGRADNIWQLTRLSFAMAKHDSLSSSTQAVRFNMFNRVTTVTTHNEDSNEATTVMNQMTFRAVRSCRQIVPSDRAVRSWRQMWMMWSRDVSWLSCCCSLFCEAPSAPSSSKAKEHLSLVTGPWQTPIFAEESVPKGCHMMSHDIITTWCHMFFWCSSRMPWQAMLLRGAEHLAEESVKQAQVGSMAHRGPLMQCKDIFQIFIANNHQ